MTNKKSPGRTHGPDEDDSDDEDEEFSSQFAEAAAEVVKPIKRAKITIGEVVKMTGLARATIRRYVDRGILTPCEVNAAGVKYFWNTDVIAFKDSGLADDSSSEEEQHNVAAQAMVSLVKEGLQHARSSAQLYFGPAQIANQQLERIIETQAARIRELEQQQNDSRQLMIELQDKKHERDLAMYEAQSKAANKQAALKEIAKGIPWIMSGVAEKLGMSPVSGKVMQFLNVIDPDKLRGLLSPEIGILSDTERAALVELLDAAGVVIKDPEPEEKPAEQA